MNVRGMSNRVLSIAWITASNAERVEIDAELRRRSEIFRTRYRRYARMMRRINPTWGGEAI